MKRLIIFILIMSLVSCGKDNVENSPCVSTKDLSSVWTLRSSGTVIDYRACNVDQTCFIIFDSPCDNTNDFGIRFNSDGTVTTRLCNGTTITDTGKWAIGCDNILRLTEWTSGDSDDILE